jgi:hypothetical protein
MTLSKQDREHSSRKPAQPTALAVADAGTGDRYRKMSLSRACSADQHAVALMLEEVAGGQVAHQGLIDRRTVEHEVVDILLWGPRAPTTPLGASGILAMVI